jgi:hypothetical protein
MRCSLTSLVVISCAFRSLAAWSPLEPSRRGAPVKMAPPTSTTNNNERQGQHVSRRTFVTSSIVTAGGSLIATSSAGASAEEITPAASESYSSIAERAAAISKSMGEETNKDKRTNTASTSADARNLYDFSLPIAGKQTPFSDIVRKETDSNNPKAVLVVNIKQDDPIARKNIPELIALAAKYVY